MLRYDQKPQVMVVSPTLLSSVVFQLYLSSYQVLPCDRSIEVLHERLNELREVELIILDFDHPYANDELQFLISHELGMKTIVMSGMLQSLYYPTLKREVLGVISSVVSPQSHVFEELEMLLGKATF